jgi:hypothetical protein
VYPKRFFVLYPAFGLIGILVLRALADSASTELRWLLASLAAGGVGLAFGAYNAWIGDRKRTDGRKRPEGWLGTVFASSALGGLVALSYGDSDLLLWCFGVFVLGSSAGFITTAIFRFSRGDFRSPNAVR